VARVGTRGSNVDFTHDAEAASVGGLFHYLRRADFLLD
jgi:hypothetical protein